VPVDAQRNKVQRPRVGNPVADSAGKRENPRVIDRDEIEATSKLLGVHTSDVQRDYLYGWLLAGLYGGNPLVRDRLVLKGGNAFRKTTSSTPGSRATSTSLPQPGCIPSSCWTH